MRKDAWKAQVVERLRQGPGPEARRAAAPPSSRWRLRAIRATFSEWEGLTLGGVWRGTLRDGAPFDYRGVTVFGVEAGRVTWGRLYLEPVAARGAGIDEAVRRMVAAPPPDPDGR